MRHLYIVCYDVSKTRKRTKVAKLLEGFGRRVNLSVFECLVSRAQLEGIITEIKKIINSKTDTVKVYYICRECYGKSTGLGREYGPGEETIFV